MNSLQRFAHLESVGVLSPIVIDRIYQTSLPWLRYEFRHFIILPKA